MKRQYVLKLTMLLAVTSVCNSCIKRTFDERDSGVPITISFDWANLAIGSTAPATMNLSFYNTDGKIVASNACTGIGFIGNLPIGTYKVLAYNTDAVGVEGQYLDNYSNAQIVTSATKAASISITQPYHVYGIGVGQVIVTSTGTDVKQITPITLARQVTLNIDITGEKSSVSSCATTLTGIARSVNISTGELLPEQGTIKFEPITTSTGLQASVSVFGRTPISTNLLSTVIQFVSGGSQLLDKDLTVALTSALANGGSSGGGGTVPVDIKLSIDVTGTVKSGFNATITNWEVVNRDLNVK